MKYMSFAGPHSAERTILSHVGAVEKRDGKPRVLFTGHLFLGASLYKPDHWARPVYVGGFNMPSEV